MKRGSGWEGLSGGRRAGGCVHMASVGMEPRAGTVVCAQPAGVGHERGVSLLPQPTFSSPLASLLILEQCLS